MCVLRSFPTYSALAAARVVYYTRIFGSSPLSSFAVQFGDRRLFCLADARTLVYTAFCSRHRISLLFSAARREPRGFFVGRFIFTCDPNEFALHPERNARCDGIFFSPKSRSFDRNAIDHSVFVSNAIYSHRFDSSANSTRLVSFQVKSKNNRIRSRSR